MHKAKSKMQRQDESSSRQQAPDQGPIWIRFVDMQGKKYVEFQLQNKLRALNHEKGLRTSKFIIGSHRLWKLKVGCSFFVITRRPFDGPFVVVLYHSGFLFIRSSAGLELEWSK